MSVEDHATDIAIIGMHGRFPGSADLGELWSQLCDGIESIRPFTDTELDAAGVPPETRSHPMFVNAGSVMDDPDGFDAEFFGISRREAETMDPQHRVMLECAWAALEHAGYDPMAYPGVVGVFGGVAQNSYFQNNLATHPKLLETLGRYVTLIGSEREFAITRIAYKLNLTGPSISINTACSTSGVALHLACQSLLAGECDAALVGGARIRVPVTAGYLYQEDGILSPDGHCRAFDAEGRGTVIASGGAMIVVKRYADALRDGDRIWAVVKGTAINNDGSDKIGYTAPGVGGQERVISEALDMARVDPATIGYVEAHGTGTFIGDPIEMEALTRAYRRHTDAVGYCGIGSIKTNIGHLDAGAGVAGVIKAALALESGEIPPSLHFETANPQIDFASSPFYVVDRLTDWPRGSTPRRAAVSSFGLGGTNAHIVLEEAPPPEPTSPSTRQQHLFVVSGRTSEALDRATISLAEHLRAHSELDPADVAHTLANGRRHLPRRRTVVASNVTEAAEALAGAAARPVRSDAAERSILFMFPGGGTQHVGMGQQLYAREQQFRRWFDRCAELSAGHVDYDLRELVSGRVVNDLDRPSHALTTLFATEFALARLLESVGIRPDLMIGHSLGEYTAACLAGVLSLEDAVALVALRGELFETLPPGAMLSVPVSPADLEGHLGDSLSLAVVNKPDLCIVAGEEAAIQELETTLSREGILTKRLRIGVAAHSHLVEPILERFGAFASTLDFGTPTIPIVSNVTGDVADPATMTNAKYWVDHLRSTVRFVDGLGAALSGDPKLAIEVGPGQTLSGLARQHPERSPEQAVVATLPHPNESTPDDVFFLEALGKSWAAGGTVDLAALQAGERRRRVPLPTYPFERTRHWIEPGEPRAEAVQPSATTVPKALPSAPSPASEESEGRPTRIATRVVELLGDLSGLSPDELDLDASFLELGFDSLFMTQASSAIGSEFGTRISFRQLFEEAPTIAALATWLDGRLPEDVPTPPPVAPGVSENELPAKDSAIASISSQLEKLQRQVAALTGQPAVAAASSPTQPMVSEADNLPITNAGPWRAPDKHIDQLDERHRLHIDELTSRLVGRSPSSKEQTQANRSHLADPRTVAGFRRAWKEMVYPVVVDRSAGSRVWDIDGNEYLDVAMGFGVNLFGHSPPFVIEAVREQLERGIEIGPQTPLALETARLISEITGHQRVAFCNTGSEAVLAAMRLSRTVTGRPKILTFANDYHGLFDEVLARNVVSDGSRRSIPIAPGIPAHAPQDLIIFDYGDPAAIDFILDHANELAAVLVEPVQSRHPDFQPVEFVRQLRTATADTGVALVFDEMITGFRSHPGGAQALFGVKADLATYGKVVGGGFPIGVVAGESRFMDALDGGHWSYGDDSIPEADVTWFAGTFVRHPVALAASRAALVHMREEGAGLQSELNRRTTGFVETLNHFLLEAEVPMKIEHFSSLFLTRFEKNQQFASLFYFHLRDQGIHITENRPAFLSTAHSDSDLERLQVGYQNAVRSMAGAGFLASGKGRALRPASSPTVVPVTEGQQEILLAAVQSDNANCAFNLSSTLHIRGPIDLEALQRAVNGLIARYDSLRVRFDPEMTRQHIAPSLEIDVAVVDLSSLEDSAASGALEAERVAEVTTPFALVDGPLIRARIVSLAHDNHHFFLTVHHAVCDGWSSGTLLRRLGQLYTADRRGEPADLPGVMSLVEYVEWFERYRSSDDHDADQAFWIDHVGTDFPVSDLPSDHPRPPVKMFRSDKRLHRIDRDLLTGLQTLASSAGVTLFTLLLGSFECLLARLSGSEEVGIGVSIAGHTRFPDRDLVAHAVNAPPLRRPVALDQSFSHHLTTTRDAFFDAFEHQDFSYGAIVRSTKARRDPSRTPLVTTTFNMDAPSRPVDLDGVVATPGSNPRHHEVFDAFVNVVPYDDHLVLECTYDVALFEAETIDRRLREWTTFLSGVVDAGPEVAVGDVGVVPVPELGLMEGWNATGMEWGGDDTLVSLFARAVESFPEAVAVVFGEGRVTYRELADVAGRVASRLVSAGVGTGSMVGVLYERSVEMVAALYGVVMAGGAYVPLDPEYPADRLGYMIDETDMTVVLAPDDLTHLMGDAAVSVIDVADCTEDEPLTLLDAAAGVDPDDVAYVFYTSGSTGRPKGVANAHRGVVNQLLWMQDQYRLGPDNVAIQKTPYSFDVSLWEFFWPLHTGARLVVAAANGHKDPSYLIETINEHHIDTIHFVPSMLRLFLDHPAAGTATSLQRVICAGEALARDLQDRFFATLPTSELHNLYGPTEAAIGVTAWQCRPDDPLPIVPIGAPIANTTIDILDDQMRPVPIGVPAELYIGGTQVALGYLNRPDLTAQRFIPDPHRPHQRLYKTGDLARWLPNGTIDFLGRLDHQIKLHGLRIELGEIETVLCEHPDVSAAAVIVDEAGEAQRLVAYVTGEETAASELKSWLGARLPSSMMPSVFVGLEVMPMTVSGKVDQNALPSPEARPVDRTAAFVAPRTPMEAEIAHVWENVIGVERVGVDDDFFELGGHSLNAMQTNARLRDVFGVELSLTDFQTHPTVGEQVLLVTQRLAGDNLDDDVLSLIEGGLLDVGADDGGEGDRYK